MAGVCVILLVLGLITIVLSVFFMCNAYESKIIPIHQVLIFIFIIIFTILMAYIGTAITYEYTALEQKFEEVQSQVIETANTIITTINIYSFSGELISTHTINSTDILEKTDTTIKFLDNDVAYEFSNCIFEITQITK